MLLLKSRTFQCILLNLNTSNAIEHLISESSIECLEQGRIVHPAEWDVHSFTGTVFTSMPSIERRLFYRSMELVAISLHRKEFLLTPFFANASYDLG